jgi:hypothetical protein
METLSCWRFKSGTRDSNPRLQPWQIGSQLKTNEHPVYGVHSEASKTPQNRFHCFGRVLTRQKCGRTLLTVTSSLCVANSHLSRFACERVHDNAFHPYNLLYIYKEALFLLIAGIRLPAASGSRPERHSEFPISTFSYIQTRHELSLSTEHLSLKSNLI